MNIQEQEERDYFPESAANLDLQETALWGVHYPERAWLLSDYDVWVKNPSYHGPEVPHPEYDQDYPDMPNEVFFRVDPLVEDLVHINANRSDRGLSPLNYKPLEDEDIPF